MDDVLPERPALDALGGPLAGFGRSKGRAAVFDADVTPFAGVGADPGATDWADLAALLGPGGTAVLTGPREQLPDGWEAIIPLDGVQMDGGALETRPDPGAVVLGGTDREAMADLVTRTRPGPWKLRTGELGLYLGIRDGDELVSMAGERMRGPGWTEISAVCTDEAYRGRGYAERLVRAVAHHVVERGDRPMLHASAANEHALRQYRRWGFVFSRPMCFDLVRAPDRSDRS
ncbi:GNAT family N-acetyltransferase [Pseudonocardia endophytica]|uniref:FR47-like protein n=1 Tax=Pseudonocardia endophytica TaxID=401976 RepID=A0A4R1HQX5_PSEEN|nr:GNAT family N-acetyltransferase [Pseudonocardia endophytica]TCK22900.1 FR47-like protein [Pseudonocardia endophytica]